MRASDGAGERSHARRQLERGGGVALAVVGLVLFVWPFVRTPPLSIGLSYAHLLAAWALVVAGLLALSRALAPRGPGRGRRDG